MRLKIVRVAIAVLFFIIAVDLFYVQVIKGRYFYSLSVNNRIRVVPLEGRRGIIKDRNGEVLADNRLAFNVTIIPQDVKDNEELFDYLSQVLKVDKKRLLQTFWQRKVAAFAPVVVAEDVEKTVAMTLEENKYRFSGLYIQESYRRRYPFKAIGSHILGYVGMMNRSEIERLKDYGYSYQSVIGKDGIENYYNPYLMGKQGGLQIEVDSQGRQVRLMSIREPENGQDIQLTIDARIQQIAAEILEDKLGAIIVMDLDSGQILGQVSAPNYDPNIFTDKKLNKSAREVIRNHQAPLLNRSIKGLYPPGSVFKTVIATGGLAAGKLGLHTTFDCKGAYRPGSNRFRCLHEHGLQDLIEAIAHSCNVYFFNAGAVLGPDIIHKFGRLLGLGTLTHIDLPHEEKGNLPSRMQRKIKFNKSWHKGDTLNYAIGQGDVLVTPIQILRMMATIARNGKEVQPHLLMTVGSNDVVKYSTIRNIRIKEDVFRQVKKGLFAVVNDNRGTARMLKLDGFEVSGKTGTAQSGKDKEDHAWFVGYELKGNVRIAFCVFLEHGGSSYNAVLISRKLLMKLREQEII